MFLVEEIVAVSYIFFSGRSRFLIKIKLLTAIENFSKKFWAIQTISLPKSYFNQIRKKETSNTILRQKNATEILTISPQLQVHSYYSFLM